MGIGYISTSSLLIMLGIACIGFLAVVYMAVSHPLTGLILVFGYSLVYSLIIDLMGETPLLLASKEVITFIVISAFFLITTAATSR